MDLSKIVAVSGKPGLFKQVSQSTRGLVLDTIPSGKKMTVFSHERLSSLEEISIYTYDDDISLSEVFMKIHENVGEGNQAPEGKSNPAVLRKFFIEVIPDHDQDRVYNSNIKKIVNWYNLLVENNMLDFTKKEEEEEESEDVSQENDDK